MNNDINDRLKELKIEDIVWIIYIGIIGLSLYANNVERHYFIYKDIISKKLYQKIMILIFGIVFIIYLYFAISTYKSVLKLNNKDSYNKIKFTYLSFIGSLLILISGAIFLYIAINDEKIETEIAFS